MDLYMQIGMVFAFMSAFIIFNNIYMIGVSDAIYNIDELVSSNNDTNNILLVRKLKNFDNKSGVSGKELSELVKGSDSLGVGVLVQTGRQNGLVAMYGKQIRDRRATSNELWYSGAMLPGKELEFERKYVMTINRLVKNSSWVSITNLNPSSIIEYSNSSNISGGSTAVSSMLADTYSPYNNSTSLSVYLSGASMYLSHPHYNVKGAKMAGKIYTISGRFYTSGVIAGESITNTDLSRIDSAHSYYNISDDWNFNTVLIEDASGNIVGVYAEEDIITGAKGILKYIRNEVGR